MEPLSEATAEVDLLSVRGPAGGPFDVCEKMSLILTSFIFSVNIFQAGDAVRRSFLMIDKMLSWQLVNQDRGVAMHILHSSTLSSKYGHAITQTQDGISQNTKLQVPEW